MYVSEIIPDPVDPSYPLGYARDAFHSAYPELWEGLVAAWVPALGGTGDVLVDIIGGRDGTLTNMEAGDWDVQRGIECLDFGGTNEHVVLTSDVYDNWTNAYTLVVHSKTTGVSDAHMISRDNSAGGRCFQLRWEDNGKIKFIRFDSSHSSLGALETVNTYNDGEWHNVIASFDATKGSRIYVDGNFDVSNGTLTLNDDGSGTTMALGARSGEQPTSEPLTGQIASVFLYNLSLLPQQRYAFGVDHLAPLRRRLFYDAPQQTASLYIDPDSDGSPQEWGTPGYTNVNGGTRYPATSPLGGTATSSGTEEENVWGLEDIPPTSGVASVAFVWAYVDDGDLDSVELTIGGVSLGSQGAAAFTDGNWYRWDFAYTGDLSSGVTSNEVSVFSTTGGGDTDARLVYAEIAYAVSTASSTGSPWNYFAQQGGM